jgi:hypothetical protein
LIALTIIQLILSSILLESNSLSDYLSIVFSVLGLVFSFLFLYGFVIIGKRYSKFLKVISVLMIIIFVFYSICSFFTAGTFEKDLTNQLDEKAKTIGFNSSQEFFEYIDANPQGSEDYANFLLKEIIPIVLPFILLMVSLLLITIVLLILFGVGLIKVGNDVRYARVTGILTIVGACTAIIFIGLLVLLISFAYMLVMLYRESRQK